MDNDQLLQALQEYADCIVNEEEPSRHLAEEVSKAATMWPGKGSAEEAKVEAMISTFENYLLQNPEVATLYRSIDGTYRTDLLDHVPSVLAAGCTLAGFQKLVEGKLK